MHMPLVKQAAVIGCGVIGAGWVARLIENGVHVRAFDPADDVSSKLDAVLLNSRHAYQELTNAPRHEEGQVEIASSVVLSLYFPPGVPMVVFLGWSHLS